MPAFVIAGVSLLGAEVGSAFLIMYAVEIGTVLTLAGGLAYSAYQAKQARRKARNEFNAAQVDRLVNVASPVAPRELVLGRVRKGGAIFFKGSTGTDNSTFVMCIALANHEIDAVEQIYFNDEPVALDSSGNVTTAPYALTQTNPWGQGFGAGAETGTGSPQTLAHTADAGSIHCYITTTTTNDTEVTYTDNGANSITTTAGAAIFYTYITSQYNANVRSYLGAAGQAADPRLMALFPTLWTAAHRAQGVAYLICEFQYNETSFPSGLPNVTAVVRGAKLYDPRTTLTVWSANPALMMRHVYQHAAFGKAAVTAAEDARITTAANLCDAAQVYTVAGVAQPSVAKYRASLVLPFGASAKDAFDDLAQAMGGAWAFAGGSLYLKAGEHTASITSLVDADLAVVSRAGASESMHPISISVHKERASKFNAVNVQIWDADQAYKQVALTPLTSTALVTADGGAALAQQVVLAAVGYAPQALHIAGIMLRDARDPLVVTMPFKLRAYPVELFDTVDVTLTRYGWAAKLFTVIGREWTGDGQLQLTLKETAASIFTVDASFSAQGYAVNTLLPNWWYVPAPGPLTVTSGTDELLRQADGTIVSRMRVRWPALNFAGLLDDGGSVEVQYRRPTDTGEWLGMRVDGSLTTAVIEAVLDGAQYLVRARCRTRSAVSDWSPWVSHQVLGKSELPATVTGVAVTQALVLWTPVTDIDLAGYEIRAVPGSTATWALGVAVHSGLVTDTPYAFRSRLVGIQTVMVAARDTSGNYGVPGSDTLDFGTIDELNVAQRYDYAAAAFPGILTTCTVSGTDLLADADPSVDWWAVGGDDWWTYGGGTDFYGGSLYLALDYIATFSPSYGGGSVVLDTTITGTPNSVQWRVDGATTGDFWDIVPGGADFWDGTYFYGAATGWVPYIGEVLSVLGNSIQWYVTVDAGPVQGIVTDMAARLQMPTLSQLFTGQAISSAGTTRLDPALGSPPVTWIAVEQVDWTIYADGSGAMSGRVIDFNATLGPLVETINAAGAAVSSTGQTARVSGY